MCTETQKLALLSWYLNSASLVPHLEIDGSATKKRILIGDPVRGHALMRRYTHAIAGRPALRRGTVLPILTFVMVILVGFLALAIDVGMMAIAKTQ